MMEQVITQAVLALRNPLSTALPKDARANDAALLERRDVDDFLWLHAPVVRNWARRISGTFSLDEAECYAAGLEALLESAASFLDKGPTFEVWTDLNLRKAAQILHLERKDRVQFEAFSLDAALTESLDLGDTVAGDLPQPPEASEIESEAFQVPWDWNLQRYTRASNSHEGPGSEAPQGALSTDFLALYAQLTHAEEAEADLRERERQLAPAVQWFMAPLEVKAPSSKVRRRAGPRVTLAFEDYLEDPTQPCGYRTVDALTEYGVRDLLGIPAPVRFDS